MSWKIPLERKRKMWDHNTQMGLINTECEMQVDITSSFSFVTLISGVGTSSSATMM
jgi:hypothetical protein